MESNFCPPDHTECGAPGSLTMHVLLGAGDKSAEPPPELWQKAMGTSTCMNGNEHIILEGDELQKSDQVPNSGYDFKSSRNSNTAEVCIGTL